jgi:hypothetical protein
MTIAAGNLHFKQGSNAAITSIILTPGQAPSSTSQQQQSQPAANPQQQQQHPALYPSGLLGQPLQQNLQQLAGL